MDLPKEAVEEVQFHIDEINWLIRQIDTWGGFLWTLSFRQSNNFLWQHPALENSLVVWVNVVDITTSQMSFIVNLKLNTQMIFLKIKNTCPTTLPPPRMIFQTVPTILPFLYWPARVNLPFLSKNLQKDTFCLIFVIDDY